MRFKPTLILFVLAAAALAYFFLVEQPRHRRRTAGDERQRRLTMVSPDHVFGLRIERGDASLSFTRFGAEWRLVEPVADLADQGSVNTLIHAAVNAEIAERFTVEASRLSEYGLADGFATIRLSDSLHADALTIDVGNLNVAKTHCYIRKPGSDELVLVGAGVRRYALRSLFDYRDKRVADLDVQAVTGLDIQSADRRRMEWRATSSGSWHLVQKSDTIRGDAVALDTILREMRALRAVEILDDDPANRTRHFSRPAGTLAFSFGDSTVAYVFSQRDGERCYVRAEGRGRIDGVAGSALDVFDRSLQDLRDRRVLHFDRDSLAKVTIDTGTGSISLVKFADEWSFANPTLGAIDQQRVAAFLATLEGLKYREIIDERVRDLSARGLDPATYHVVLLDAESRVIDEARCGRLDPHGRVRYATSRSSPLLGVLDVEPLEGLDSLFVRLQSR
jgi:hypothetical protein